MLILFDIDGTLLRSQRAGLHAMADAAQEMLGREISLEIETAGRLDPLIWGDLARLNGLDDPHEHHDRFRTLYTENLRNRLRDKPTAYALSGVADLIDELRQIEDLTLGLLTGNYAETGRLKIESAGLDADVFKVAAWGTDGDQRRDLPPVAMARYAEHSGVDIESERVLIIGDTPHDVDCARHNGCRSLGVATGTFSIEELKGCTPDLAVSDLAETDRLREWIVNG